MKDDHADYPALTLAGFMTGGGFLNSRLAVRLRQKDGLCYGVGAWLSAGFWDDDASLGGYAIYAPQNAAKLEAGFREELARVVETGFTAEEVAQAKAGWLQEQRVSRAQDQELAGQLSYRHDQGRTLAWDRDFEAAVEALTPQQIHEAFKRHVDPAAMSVVQAGSFASVPPAKP
jgi:zinc protease